MFNAIETGDLDGLRKLFLKNGLVVSEDSKSSLVKCWETRTEDGSLIAGLRLEKRGDEFVIVSICVEEKYRGHGIGKLLLDKSSDKVKNLGGKRILLVAKAPGFFKKLGFVPAESSIFKGIISCSGCELLNNDCKPMFMSKNL